jgi:hypothetical protein
VGGLALRFKRAPFVAIWKAESGKPKAESRKRKAERCTTGGMRVTVAHAHESARKEDHCAGRATEYRRFEEDAQPGRNGERLCVVLYTSRPWPSRGVCVRRVKLEENTRKTNQDRSGWQSDILSTVVARLAICSGGWPCLPRSGGFNTH